MSLKGLDEVGILGRQLTQKTRCTLLTENFCDLDANVLWPTDQQFAFR